MKTPREPRIPHSYIFFKRELHRKWLAGLLLRDVKKERRFEHKSNLLLAFASTVIHGFGPHGTRDHIFVRSKSTYVF
jgi:hypothetical protein